MTDVQLKNVRIWLLIASGVHFILFLKSGFALYQTLSMPPIDGFSFDPSLYLSLGLGLIFPVIFLIASLKASEGLKEGSPYHWVLAISLFVLSIFSWAVFAAVLGLMVLLDRRVRTPFIQKLDFQL